MITRTDLSSEEWVAFEHINRHDSAFISEEMCERLSSLGLIRPALGGWVTSAQGEALMAAFFARTRAKRAQEARQAALTPEVLARKAHQRLMEQRRGR